MTDYEILAVVQAHKEGKQIQGKCRRLSNIWVDIVGELTWDFVDKEYRVKPEPRKPREWDAAVSMDGKLRTGIIDLHALDCERIRVREVIEE